MISSACRCGSFDGHLPESWKIMGIPRIDAVNLCRADAEKHEQKHIIKSVKHGRFQSIEFNPASRDYRKNKDGRTRHLKQRIPLEWSPPGRGQALSSCGFPVRNGDRACLEAHFFTSILQSCKSPSCPKCFPRWSTRTAKVIDDKMTSYTNRMRGEGKWIHAVLSPPQEFAKSVDGSEEGFKLLLGWVDEICKRMGIHTGYKFFHPWRQDGEDGIENAVLTGNSGDSKRWRHAPHFHVVGYCTSNLSMLSESNYENTGWVVKDVASDISEYRVQLIDYVLSHVGVAKPCDPDNPRRKRIRCYRPFGEISQEKLIESIDTEEKARCPCCDGTLHPVPESLELGGLSEPCTVKMKLLVYANRRDEREILRRLHESGNPWREALDMRDSGEPLTCILVDPNTLVKIEWEKENKEKGEKMEWKRKRKGKTRKRRNRFPETVKKYSSPT